MLALLNSPEATRSFPSFFSDSTISAGVSLTTLVFPWTLFPLVVIFSRVGTVSFLGPEVVEVWKKA